MQNNKIVCMLGAGAWGTAVAMLLAENGYTVKLWCHEKEVAQAIKATGCNQQYLPGVQLHKNIIPTAQLEEALRDTRWIFEAIPVKHVRSVLVQTTSFITPEHVWVVLSKGIEQDTLLLPSQIIDDVFKNTKNCHGFDGVRQNTINHVVVTGPSFAHDLVNKQITAVTVAADDYDRACTVQAMLANSYFKPHVSVDLIGAQVGGALKNVIAIGVGMLEGAGYTDNTKAFLLTRGLDEMAQLAVLLGGKPETLHGLAGIGDLVLTALGGLSRNLAIGRRLGASPTKLEAKRGAGEKLAAIEQEDGNLPEGVSTCKSVHQLIQKHNLDLPVFSGVYAVAYEGKSVQQMMEAL